MSVKLLLLTAADIDQCLTISEVIETLEEAFKALQQNQVTMPLRTALPVPEHEGNSLMMPVYMPSINMIGLKVVNIFKNNLKHGLPAIHALIMLFDATTGKPVALLDGERITALRTGAVSGLATRYLARENSETVAIIGAGVQGKTQLQAMLAVRPISRVLVIDRTRERAKHFVEEMQNKYDVFFEIAETDQLFRADIICTATTSNQPVFRPEKIKPGTHINAVGSYRPQMQEVPEEVVSKAKVVVDLKSAALKEAGDLIIPLQKGLITENSIHAELGELVLGKTSGRSNDQEITLFKSVGLAVQDLATAYIALQKAQKMNLGQKISL